MITPLQLYYYQRHALNDIFDYTRENHGKHPIAVLPTGAGKSLLQAHIVNRMLEYEGTRILLLTHQQLLIQQNLEELITNFQNDIFLDVGVYSAGLKKRDTQNRVLFAGIQSVDKRAWELGFFDMILVDEAHLINNKNTGRYRFFFTEMLKINPKIVIVGLSATAYRMKEGWLTDGDDRLFHAICHETTVPELIDPNHPKNLDNKQFLCTLISKNGVNKADLSEVPILGGEYVLNKMQKAFTVDDLVRKAVLEIKEYSVDRKKCLIFTAGIEHCEEVVKAMLEQGMQARCVHSEQSNVTNKQNIIDFKSGEFKYLLNVNSLTTGFNVKSIDFIALLRSTRSPGLYYQMCGRGFRLHPDKIDCLILDFGGNIDYHGPIDKIVIRSKKEKGEGGDPGSPYKTCPGKEGQDCGAKVFKAVMVCETCGYEFPVTDKHEETASEADVLSKWKKPETFEVDDIYYNLHQKQGKPSSLKVTYYVGMMESYSEWVCLEHQGFAKEKACSWVNRRTDKDINTVQDALDNYDYFRQPKKIVVNLNDKFPKITGYVFETEEEYENRLKELRGKEKEEYDDLIPF
jgi:DNA repair protein RadD